MPFVRIDLLEGKPEDYRAQVGDVVHRAMLATIGVPEADRFQIITEHPQAGLSFDRDYLGVHRSSECIFIQVTLNAGRTTEAKQAFYKAVADGLHDAVSLRREDVFISLIEVKKEDWAFGNGEAQYVSAK